jgi:gliding motility associated protien GldN
MKTGNKKSNMFGIHICLLSLTFLFQSLNAQQGVLDPASSPIQDGPIGAYKKENSEGRFLVPYVYVREADVTWHKRVWRSIDIRERRNQVFKFPLEESRDRTSFIQMIVKQLGAEYNANGTATFDGKKVQFSSAPPVAYKDDEFLEPIEKKEILKKLCRITCPKEQDAFDLNGDSCGGSVSPVLDANGNPVIDSETNCPKQFISGYGTGDPTGCQKIIMGTSIKDCKWIFNNFCGIDIKEDWFFDKQRGIMDSRIIALGISIIPLDASGQNDEAQGCTNWIWIYFPEWRQFFANNEVFNVDNDAERRTYEDVFWKRQFNSQITKESNVYDRKISDYAKGIDALLESERVKNDIFKLEHDWWQF